jgi:hypothetical protein
MEKGTETPKDWDIELPNQPPFPIPRAATSKAPPAATPKTPTDETSKASTEAPSKSPASATSKVPTTATSKALAAAKVAATSKEQVKRPPYQRVLARKTAGGAAPKPKARTLPPKKQLYQRNLPTQASHPAKAATKPWGNVQWICEKAPKGWNMTLLDQFPTKYQLDPLSSDALKITTATGLQITHTLHYRTGVPISLMAVHVLDVVKKGLEFVYPRLLFKCHYNMHGLNKRQKKMIYELAAWCILGVLNGNWDKSWNDNKNKTNAICTLQKYQDFLDARDDDLASDVLDAFVSLVSQTFPQLDQDGI